MIISDDHRFVFVHVPKCAGSSVKRALRPIDTTGATFQRIGDHPRMGTIHYAHITLRDLEAFFPTEFAKIRSYRSVAILRDPTERFYSAIFQRLREFRGYAQSAITPATIEQEAVAVRRYLESAPERLDLHHVHFNRQADFVEHDGEQIVSSLYSVERMVDVARFISETTGVSIGEERANRTTELAFGPMKPLQRLLRGPYARLVPAERRARLRERMTQAGLYRNVRQRRFTHQSGTMTDFVQEYYAQDFALYRACSGY